MSLSVAFAPGLVRIDALRAAVLSWHIPAPTQTIRGIRLLTDAPRGSGPIASVVRSILRANPRIAPLDALELAIVAHDAARNEHLDSLFLSATLLQESAFDPSAISSAGAVGLGQFTVSTATEAGVAPFDARSAIAGTARLLAEYVARYRGPHIDAYALALAAYNAGPQAVAFYHGVPPYAETREYISDIHERLARLVDER